MPTAMMVGLDDTAGDVTERDGLVLPLDDGEQGDRRADVGDGDDDLEERAQGHLRVGAGSGNVVGVVQQGAIQKGSGYGENDGDDEEDAGNQRTLSQ